MLQAKLGRRGLLGGMAAAGAMASFGARAHGLPEAELGSLWQGIELIDADGRRFRLGDTGQPLTMVKLWANWCPACLRDLNALQAMLSASATHGMDVLLVSHPNWWDEDREAARTQKMPFRMATLSSRNDQQTQQAALLDENGYFAVPQSFLYRKATRSAVWAHRGPVRWTSPMDVAALKAWVA